MQSMLKNAPTGNLEVLAKPLAKEAGELPENKRAPASQRTRGVAREARSGAGGDAKAGYGSGWANRPKTGGRQDDRKEKEAEQEEDSFQENWGAHSPAEGAVRQVQACARPPPVPPIEACATEDSAREAQEMMILDERHNIPYLEREGQGGKPCVS